MHVIGEDVSGDARHRPSALTGQGDPPTALRLPRLRGSGAAGDSTGATADRGHGDRSSAGSGAGRQVQRSSAALSPGQIFARHGIEIDRSTLANWVGGACWWLRPLAELLLGSIFASQKLFADDTPIPVLDPGRGRTKTGRLWVYARDDRPWQGPLPPAVAYLYSENRQNENPLRHLADFTGVLQVDGYAGFERWGVARAAGPRAPQVLDCNGERPRIGRGTAATLNSTRSRRARGAATARKRRRERRGEAKRGRSRSRARARRRRG